MPSRAGASGVQLGSFRLAELGVFTPPQQTRFYDGLLTRGASNPILRNQVGTYDEDKCGPAEVIKVGAGDYRIWYEGIQNTVGSDDPTLPCYATSPDGTVWTKYVSNPIMNGAVAWENNEVSPVAVLYDPDAAIWKMWYHGGNNTGLRQIGYATSPDGIVWTKYAGNPIIVPGSSGSWEEWIADAKVIRFGPTDYRMWYRGSNNTSGASSYGYATSTDGITWTKYPGNPIINAGSSGAWNDGYIMAFAPLWDASQSMFHAWAIGTDALVGYGANIGYYSSLDGINWTESPSNPVLSTIPGDVTVDSITAYWDGLRARVVYGQYDLTASPVLRGKGEAYIDASTSTTITIPIASGPKDGHITREKIPVVWPPDGAITPNDFADTAYAVFLRKVYHTTFNFSECALACLMFDTSSLPDDAIITSATVRAVLADKQIAGGLAKNLDLEWYDFLDGTIDAADWAENISPTAGTIPFATWSAYAIGASIDIPLSNADANIDRSGETGIRLAFSSGALSGATNPDNILTFYSLENVTYAEPKLIIAYSLPTVSQKLRPDADIDATGWSVAPLWSKIEEDVADGVVITGVAS